jgi:hypothetical protein
LLLPSGGIRLGATSLGSARDNFADGFDDPLGRVSLGTEPADKPSAKQFPLVLPDPRYHPVILVDGLHAWFKSLTAEYSRVFLRYLFKFDPDQQTPAPGLYLQPISTYRLASVYDMSPLVDRDAFSRMVSWRGIEDEIYPPTTPGFCYLELLAPSARSAAAATAGACPDVSVLSAYSLNSGLYDVQLTGPSLYHVSRSFGSRGLTAGEVLACIPSGCRVGAAVGDKMVLMEGGLSSLAPGPRTGFEIFPDGQRTSLTLAMYAVLDKGKHLPTVSWSPLLQPAFLIMLGIYESVRLESAEFNVSVSAGQGNSCWCAINNASSGAPQGEGWCSCPVLKFIDGSDDGTVVSDFRLPAQHSFSKELRAASIGNDPPRFHFGYNGAAGGNAVVMGRFTVSVSGQKPMGALDANPEKTPKTTRELRQMLATLPPQNHDRCSRDDNDDEESSDDDDDEVPVVSRNVPTSGTARSSPNRA